MSGPQFSIIIPTYERAAVVPAAIRSVLAQTDPDFELLVVDDGSTDDIAGVVAAFDDERVALHRRPHAGVSATRNAGVALARGEFVVFLDSDDELLPDALAQFRAAAHDRCDLVLAGWVQASADRRNWRTRLPSGADGRGDGREVGEVRDVRGGFLPGAFAVRTEVLRTAGGYDEELRFGENSALAWRSGSC
jgi:glycosyltransferase involved in cell wall biosynthesis